MPSYPCPDWSLLQSVTRKFHYFPISLWNAYKTNIKIRCLCLSASLSLLSTGIPLVCFLVLMPLNIPWSQISVTWLGVVHFLACLSPQLGSVVYHLFMNHEGGEPVYHTLLKLDMCGICMINTLGTYPGSPFTFMFRAFSGCFYLKRLTIRTFVRRKRNNNILVLTRDLKDDTDLVCLRFHNLGARTAKSWSPVVTKRDLGTTRRGN